MSQPKSSNKRKVFFGGGNNNSHPKNGETQRAAATEPLDPPSFRLPSTDDDPDRYYELWTVRLPAGEAPRDLQGVTFQNDRAFERGGVTYAVQAGHAADYFPVVS